MILSPAAEIEGRAVEDVIDRLIDETSRRRVDLPDPRRAILVAAAGAPVALAVGVLAPGLLVWRARPGRRCSCCWLCWSMPCSAPAARGAGRVCGCRARPSVGETVEATVDVAFAGASRPRAARRLALAAANGAGRALDRTDGAAQGAAATAGAAPADCWPPMRRGTAAARAALAALARAARPGLEAAQPARCEPAIADHARHPAGARRGAPAVRSATRCRAEGAAPDRGEGAEFEALAEFRPGMDRRAIDWKQSARHGMLLAKEYRTERNNHIVLAIDAGRLMCEPVAGLPRIDRAVSAALLTAFVALKDGDRVGSSPSIRARGSPAALVAGAARLPELQRLAAGIDYSARRPITPSADHARGAARRAAR